MAKCLVLRLAESIPNDSLPMFSEIPVSLQSYFNSLSSPLSQTKKDAFVQFYNDANDLKIWDKLAFFYPMIGTLSDCELGIVGSRLSIPEGCNVNANGIDTSGISGGVGAKGDGIALPSVSLNKEGIAIGCYSGEIPTSTTCLMNVTAHGNHSDCKGGITYSTSQSSYMARIYSNTFKATGNSIGTNSAFPSQENHVTCLNNDNVGYDNNEGIYTNAQTANYDLAINGHHGAGFVGKAIVKMVWSAKGDLSAITIDDWKAFNIAINRLVDALS